MYTFQERLKRLILSLNTIKLKKGPCGYWSGGWYGGYSSQLIIN